MKRSNVAFGIVVGGFVFAAFGAWWLLHPDSPRFERAPYDVVFPEIGTLDAGNAVQVNGMKMGEVQKVWLDPDDGLVRVRVGVLKTVPLPEDSRFRVVNVGMVGERAVEIRPGESKTILAPGSLVRGEYDPGATRLVVIGAAALAEIDSLSRSLAVFADEFMNERERARYARLGTRFAKQADRLVSLARESAGEAKGSLEELEKLSASLSALAEKGHANLTLMGIEKGAPAAEGAAKVGEALPGLRERLDALAERLERIGDRMERTEGSSLLELARNPEFAGQVRAAADDGAELLKSLGK